MLRIGGNRFPVNDVKGQNIGHSDLANLAFNTLLSPDVPTYTFDSQCKWSSTRIACDSRITSMTGFFFFFSAGGCLFLKCGVEAAIL